MRAVAKRRAEPPAAGKYVFEQIDGESNEDYAKFLSFMEDPLIMTPTKYLLSIGAGARDAATASRFNWGPRRDAYLQWLATARQEQWRAAIHTALADFMGRLQHHRNRMDYAQRMELKAIADGNDEAIVRAQKLLELAMSLFNRDINFAARMAGQLGGGTNINVIAVANNNSAPSISDIAKRWGSPDHGIEDVVDGVVSPIKTDSESGDE